MNYTQFNIDYIVNITWIINHFHLVDQSKKRPAQIPQFRLYLSKSLPNIICFSQLNQCYIYEDTNKGFC